MRCPVLRSYQAAPLRSAAQSHRSALRVSSWALNPWKWSRNVGNQAAVRTSDLSVRHVALADSAASCGVSCTHLSVDAPLLFVWLCAGLCVRQRLDVRDHLRTIRLSRTSEYISSIKGYLVPKDVTVINIWNDFTEQESSFFVKSRRLSAALQHLQ